MTAFSNLFNFDCNSKFFNIMKAATLALVYFTYIVLFGIACCIETEFEGYRHDGKNKLNETTLMGILFKPQKFTPGTLLGLIVASLVVVIGSFLVLWRLCCEVDIRATKEAKEPLTSISKNVSEKKPAKKTKLLSKQCSSSVLEIA